MKQYTAIYFHKTKKIIKKFKPKNEVTLQFFQRFNNVLFCGINEVLDILKKHTNISQYEIKYLPEKTIIEKKEVVLQLKGPYQYFGEYEGIIDGILSRATSLATNAYRLKQLTNKQIIFMGDRADHYYNQEKDGYAIHVGGIDSQVTSSQVAKHNGQACGTMPHALIQMFNGSLINAMKAYHKTFPNEKLTALVDFNNDVIQDSLMALKQFKTNLHAIRIDTSPNLSDKMFKNKKEYGVTPNMIKNVRKHLDQNNGKHVKIIVSSSIDATKIKQFEQQKAPVDIYGVGKNLLNINIFFSADAVQINGQDIAKAGRNYQNNPKLKVYNS